MVYAALDEHYVCTGFSVLAGSVTHWNAVFLPSGWDEDLRWRKYVNGEWSAEKYLPLTNTELPVEEQVNKLKEQFAITNATVDFLLGM